MLNKQLRDQAADIVTDLAKNPPMTYTGRARELAQCALCGSKGKTQGFSHFVGCPHARAKRWVESLKEQERTDRATSD